MTYASPLFGVLYASAFVAGVLCLVFANRLEARTSLALAVAVAVAGGFVAGMAARGMTMDVSGTAFVLPEPPRLPVDVPARLAPASGRDGQLSVDAFGAAGSPAARTERLVLKRSDALLVQGWAYDPVRDTPCEAVAAVVDGRAYGAVYGVERPDVAAMFGAKHANTGYRLQVEASRFGPGRHAFELRCLQPSGRSLASPPMSFEVQP